MSVLESVNDFRRKIGVDESSPILVKEVLSKLHIFTMYREMSLGVSGMSIRNAEGQMGILVNSALPLGRQHETIAHELYHLFYDSNPQAHICQDYRDDVAERSATEFSKLLLLPEAGVHPYFNGVNMTNREELLRLVLVLENRFRVSRDFVILYLEEHKLCSDEMLSFLREDDCRLSSEKFGYGTKLYEPGNANLVISDYEEKAKLLLDRQVISMGHYNELITQLTRKK